MLKPDIYIYIYALLRWDTFHILAYCGLVVEIPTYLLNVNLLLPFQCQASIHVCTFACVYVSFWTQLPRLRRKPGGRGWAPQPASEGTARRWHCGWLRNPLRTTLFHGKASFVGIYRGDHHCRVSLGGAGFRPSTV